MHVGHQPLPCLGALTPRLCLAKVVPVHRGMHSDGQFSAPLGYRFSRSLASCIRASDFAHRSRFFPSTHTHTHTNARHPCSRSRLNLTRHEHSTKGIDFRRAYIQREEDNKAIMHEMHQKVCRGNVRVRACACVCVRVRACACVCVRGYICRSPCVRAPVCVCAHVCADTRCMRVCWRGQQKRAKQARNTAATNICHSFV